MARGEIISAVMEKIALGGDGLALLEGKRIFIPLSAPGDVVKARIIEERGSWARAEILEIEEKSPDRTEPCCPHYGTCGGCSLQHLSYSAQLKAKAAILAEALNSAAAEEPLPSITAIPSEPWEYRNRVSLHAIRSNRFPRCGFKARQSEEVIPLDDCPVCDPGIRRILPRLLPPPGKDRFTLYSKDETLIAETGTSFEDKQIQSRGTISLGCRKITLDAASFFQSNAHTLEKLVRQLGIIAEEAANKAGGNGTMADLYAGAGTFSVFLFDLFPGGVDLVESDSRALNLAKINLGRPEYTPGNCRFFNQKAEQWAARRNLNNYAFIAADPPRQGLSPVLVQSLCRSGPEYFVYISCEASTFARDYHVLSQSYQADSLFLFDFYPQTAHIETMGIFSRK